MGSEMSDKVNIRSELGFGMALSYSAYTLYTPRDDEIVRRS
jgi:hypothetical protein